MTPLLIALLVLPVLALVALLMTERGLDIKRYAHFFVTGLDSGFRPRQIVFLGKIGKTAGIEDLTTLFWSISALDRCTAEIVRRARQTGTDYEPGTQTLLSSLYAYRTKIELDQSKKRRGLTSTRDIDANQKVRILLRGVGVFTSRVLRTTSRYLVLDYPSHPTIPATSQEWVGKQINVYFWRHDDAGYVFDTVVVPDPVSEGKAVINVAHTTALVRSQKRKSIRAKCSIYAQLYLLMPDDPLENALEPEPGMKCLIEDISEDGAKVTIGGHAVKDMKIKLQFMLRDVLIVMAGVIRAVEYNKATNQSRIHVECGELNPRMKNSVLTFVYNVLPEEEKEELDAIRLTEEDGIAADGEAPRATPDLPVIDEVKPGPDLPDFANK